MLSYLSNEFMLDTLKKVQPLQVKLLQAGASAHLDASVNENRFSDEPGTHIDFSVDVFIDNNLEKSFDFSPNDTEEQVNAELAALRAYANSL